MRYSLLDFNEVLPTLVAEGLGRFWANGGYTFGPDWASADISSGYAVSLSGGRQVPVRVFCALDLFQFAADHRYTLRQEGYYLGLWREGETVYIDITLIVPTWQDAVRIGQAHGQKAIYSYDTGVVEEVPYGELVTQPTAQPAGAVR